MDKFLAFPEKMVGLAEPTGAYVEGGFQTVLVQQGDQPTILHNAVIIAEGQKLIFHR